MSLPTEAELQALDTQHGPGKYCEDSEGYHCVFDELLEAKLDALDPEWMAAMRKLYEESRCARWCA